MNEVTRNCLALSSLVLVALYGVLALSPISNSDIAVALAPNDVPAGKLPIPDADPNIDSHHEQLWYLAPGVSEIEAVESQHFEPVVANLSTDILAEERARFLRELDSSRDGLRRWVGDEIDRTEKKIKALDSRIEAILPSLATTAETARIQNNRD